jgi:hypothetical protein
MMGERQPSLSSLSIVRVVRAMLQRARMWPPVGRGLACMLGALALLAFSPALPSAFAQSAPWWQVSSSVRPSNLAPGGEGTITVKAVNIGDATTSGPERLSDVLPAGLKIQEEEVEGEMVPSVRFLAFSFFQGQFDLGPGGPLSFLHLCGAKGNEIACSTETFELISPVTPYEDLEMQIQVTNGGASSNDVNKGTISGGSASTATTTRALDVSSSRPAFGVERSSFSITPEEEGGDVDAQAGSHPFQLTTTFALNQNANPAKPPALARNIAFKLPAGLVGNVASLPRCSDHDFRELASHSGFVNHCAPDTAIGVAVVTIDEPATLELTTLPVPLFNLAPGEGEPARFGFEASGSVVTLDTAVRTGSDYGVTVSTNNITQLISLVSSTVSVWGVPGDSRHDQSRGWGCLVNHHWGEEAGFPCELERQTSPKPFLTLPTKCHVPFTTSVEGSSWPLRPTPEAEPVSLSLTPVSYTLESAGREAQMTGCNQLPFAASIDVQPDSQEASSPTGLAVHVRVPQEAGENPEGLASSTLKNVTVTLPEGVTINPASAGGLQACSEAEIGFRGEEAQSGLDLFSSDLPSPFCPEASKIGTAEIVTPLLPPEQHLKGAVYLAAQGANPFNSLIAMYIVARDPVSGVLVKIPGLVALDPATGRITSTLRNAPPLPFQEAILRFFSGSRAPLTTPSLCRRPGETGYTTLASFDPWSETGAVGSSPEFDITTGPGGSACPNPAGTQSPGTLPFKPSLIAGTTSTRAGGYTPLTTTVLREDGNQEIGSLQLHMPPGIAATIPNVTPCAEQQANEGTCGPASLIGHADVSVGVGATPFNVQGGQVFLTGPYRGAPFGLSIASPAKAGPFDLGEGVCDCIVVRASLQIDPRTAQVTVSTDPSGTAHAIPHMLQGIPLRIRQIDATIDRPNFTFNPTDCEPLSITADITSELGALGSASTPFQVANCTRLAFTPKLSITVDGRTSKRNGVGLVSRLVYPRTPPGTQANIKKVKVVLPKQLPSRLTTLQQACLAKVFDENPAKCPSHSIVGHASVITSVLPVPLTGPAYFVSHGNEAFPALTIVLHGDNVTVELVGATRIHNGITSTTFNATPDVPFTSFELTLPRGAFSVLGAFGSLCKSKLTMPTEMIAQDGQTIHRTTKIAVTHCSRRHHKHAHKRARPRKGGSKRHD